MVILEAVLGIFLRVCDTVRGGDTERGCSTRRGCGTGNTLTWRRTVVILWGLLLGEVV